MLQDMVTRYNMDDHADDRKAGRLGVYNILSPNNITSVSSDGDIVMADSIDREMRNVVFAEKFFTHYLITLGNRLPDSHIHLGFHNSLYNTGLAYVFMNAGAKCVTGYSGGTNATYGKTTVINSEGGYNGTGTK